VAIRPCGPADEAALRDFLGALAPHSRRSRFFTGAIDIARAAHWAAEPEEGRYGLIALDADGAIVGHAVYATLHDERPPARAEVAVEVADRLHGQGLGTILVERIAAVAEHHRIERFVAEVLPENRAMLDVFRDGFDARVTLHGGTDAVEFATAAWRLAAARFGHE
jgi:GNAT superfamily N-acetyltransferase